MFMAQRIYFFLQQYGLILLGLFMLLLFLWAKFLRQRLPKDIPFIPLSFYRLYFLIFICIIFFILMKNLIRPGKKNLIVEYFSSLIYKPLESLDSFLKTGWNTDEKILHISKKLEYSLKDTNVFYWGLYIIPRIILVTTLFIDTFYFHRLHYIYYMLFLGIFLILQKYILYSFKITKKTLIATLEKDISHITTAYVEGVHPEDDPDDPDYELLENMALPLGIFIDFQTKNIIYSHYAAEYTFYFTNKVYALFKEESQGACGQTLTEKAWRTAKKNLYKDKIEDTLALSVIIESYTSSHQKDKKFRSIKIAIFAGYFCCWTYILIVSLPYAMWDEILPLIYTAKPYEILGEFSVYPWYTYPQEIPND